MDFIIFYFSFLFLKKNEKNYFEETTTTENLFIVTLVYAFM